MEDVRIYRISEKDETFQLRLTLDFNTSNLVYVEYYSSYMPVSDDVSFECETYLCRYAIQPSMFDSMSYEDITKWLHEDCLLVEYQMSDL